MKFIKFNDKMVNVNSVHKVVFVPNREYADKGVGFGGMILFQILGQKDKDNIIMDDPMNYIFSEFEGFLKDNNEVVLDIDILSKSSVAEVESIVEFCKK